MIKWINKKRNKKGFTLVELVVVIAILGILATIAIPKLTTSKKAAQEAAHKANIRTIEGALSMYYAESGSYPEDGNLENSYTSLDNYIQKMPIYTDTTGNAGAYTHTGDGVVKVVTPEG